MALGILLSLENEKLVIRTLRLFAEFQLPLAVFILYKVSNLFVFLAIAIDNI